MHYDTGASPVQRALPLKVLIGLAARNVGRNKARSALSLAAIAAGVAGLILSGGFVHDLIRQLGEFVIHSQSGHIQIAKAGYFESGTRFPGKYLMSPDDLRRAETGIPEKAEVMRRISFSGLASNGLSSYPIVGEGIEPDRESRLGTFMVLMEGRNLSPKDQYGALVGAGVARAMDLKPGSLISLVAPTVDGAMNTVDVEVTGIFQSYSKDYDERIVKISLARAQELLNTRGVNVLVLLLSDTRNTARVASLLVAEIKALGLEFRTWDQLNDFYRKTVDLYDRQFGVLRLIVLIMVILAVVGAVNMGVLERVGEFGTMRALGNTSWDVMRLVMLEGLLMGALGATIGVITGMGSAWVISQVGIPMPPPPNSNLAYTARILLLPSVIAGAFFVGAFATVLASVIPALRVSRLPVVEALRRLV